MAKQDIGHYSLDEIEAMAAQGKSRKTPTNTPVFEPSEAFWRKARIVKTKTRINTLTLIGEQ